MVVVGYLQHKTVLEFLRTAEAKPRPRWPLTITATAGVVSFLLSVLIGVSTRSPASTAHGTAAMRSTEQHPRTGNPRYLVEE